jgi:hypothetical protein
MTGSPYIHVIARMRARDYADSAINRHDPS